MESKKSNRRRAVEIRRCTHRVRRLLHAQHFVHRTTQPDDPPGNSLPHETLRMPRTFEEGARESTRDPSLSLQLRTPPPNSEVRYRDPHAGDASASDDTETFLPRRFLFTHHSGIFRCSGSSGQEAAGRPLRGTRLPTSRAVHGRVTTIDGGSATVTKKLFFYLT